MPTLEHEKLHLKTKFDMENNTSTKNENGNDANRLLSPAFLQSLDWWQLYKVAEPLVAKISVEKLHEKLLEIYPLEKSQEYVGSLCNHYRGRLKHEGKFALIDQMCSNSMRRLIIGLAS